MKFGICDLAAIPLRLQAGHRHEMTSQLVFGETYLVLDEVKRWVHIECAHDGYQGWIAASQFHEISEEEFRELKAAPFHLLAEPYAELLCGEARKWIPAGSLLHWISRREHQLQAQTISRPLAFDAKSLSQVTSMYLNAPYLWGGRTPFGIDCSGFAQMTFRFFGKKLLRDAHQQSEQGTQIEKLSDAQTGDLAFFEEEGRITHVGILLADGAEQAPNRIIHAAGRVKVCNFDEKGIFDAEAQRYTHYLDRIRRV